MATIKQLCECPRCNGTGHLPEYSGILNGVCFKCGGSGRVAYRVSKPAPVVPLSDFEAREIAMIETGDLSGLGYNRLAQLRDFAHGTSRNRPANLLQTWRERGDAFFFRAQEIKLAELYANR